MVSRVAGFAQGAGGRGHQLHAHPKGRRGGRRLFGAVPVQSEPHQQLVKPEAGAARRTSLYESNLRGCILTRENVVIIDVQASLVSGQRVGLKPPAVWPLLSAAVGWCSGRGS